MSDIIPENIAEVVESEELILARVSAKALVSIARSLKHIQRELATKDPNYKFRMGDYGAQFNWESIGATIEEADNRGATIVRKDGFVFTRRHGSGKYGTAIWFSRPNGKDEAGEVKYMRLCTFKDYTKAEKL